MPCWLQILCKAMAQFPRHNLHMKSSRCKLWGPPFLCAIVPKVEEFRGVINSVMWWYSIFRDWLLKWRSLYISLITWVIPSCATSPPRTPPNFRCFILNCSFASVFPLQIQKVILSLGDYMQAGCHACIGGTNVRSEINKLSAGAPHIVVGTPGRVYDMLSRGHLCEYPAELMSSSSLAPFPKLKLDCWLSSAGSKFIKMFVLDEADEMLSRGFKDQIYEIFQKLSTNIQVSVTGDTHMWPWYITEVF